METNVDSNRENIVEQLDQLIRREKDLLLNSMHESGRLEVKLELFMASLQQQINRMLKSETSDQPLTTEGSKEAEEAKQMLEKEFSSYNVNLAKNIINHRRPASYIVKQSLMGSAVAVGLLWFFMPQSWQEQVDLAFEKTVVGVQELAESNKPGEIIKNAVKSAKTGAVGLVEQAVVSVEAVKAKIVDVEELAVEGLAGDEIRGEPVVAVKEPILNGIKPVADSKVESLLDIGKEAEAVIKVKEPETFIGQKLTVTAHIANARNIPDNKGKRLTRVKMGDVVTKLNEQLGWYQVKLENGTVAWVYKSVFAPRLQVVVGIGNVRLEPNGKAKILARINNGDFVTKLEEKNGWYLVKLDSGIRAWGHRSIF